MYEKIGFIGLGLIGGSLAKTIKRVHPNIKMYATSGRETTVKSAYDEGLIENEKPITLRELASLDLVFLCAPVQLNNEYLSSIKYVVGENTIITDVGSVKGDIHRYVDIHGLSEHFIGGHPMAGSEKTGLNNATDTMLENKYYIITPTSSVAPEKVEEYRNFIESLGAIPKIMDAKKHDRAAAAISHVPHMISYCLANMVSKIDYDDATMKTLAAGGFRDMTRIAASSPVMWEDICVANRGEIVEILDEYLSRLGELKELIKQGDGDALNQYFTETKEFRDTLFQ